MSKNITKKIREMLTPEDLKIFEGAIESLINDKVKSKLNDMITLKEEELKNKYDTLAEEYVQKEIEKRLVSEKASIVESYDKKLNLLEKRVVSKLDSFLDHVITEQISDESIEKLAINEVTLPVIDKIKSVFAESNINITSDGEKTIKESEESIKSLETQLSESIAKNMELEERLEKSAVFILMSEKTDGLTNSQKNRVIEMFKDKHFDEVEKKIDGFIELIKEGDTSVSKKKTSVIKRKKINDVIAEGDNIEVEPKTKKIKKIITENDQTNEYTLSNAANAYLED
ncbi:MAG: hypothetical protein ACOCZ5_00075 [bacterium]